MNRTVLCYLLLSLLIALDACRNPLDGVTIRLKDPLQAGIVDCRLYDPSGNPRPGTTQIILAGPDAGEVVTTLNTRNFKINSDGVLLLAPSPNVLPSAADPVRFTLALETPGYLTVVQPFIIANNNRQGRYMPLISLTRPPESVTPAQLEAGQGGADGALLAGVSLTTRPSLPAVDRAGIALQPGTVCTDREGAAVAGMLTAQLIHTNARTNNPGAQLPGGTILDNVAGFSGGTLPGTMRLQTIAGSLTVTLYNEAYQLVNTLSKPIHLTMELNPVTTNQAKGRIIQVGDSIPLFRYDAQERSWQQVRPGVILRDDVTGRLVLHSDVSKTGAYIAAWTQSVCKLGPVFRVSSKLSNVDVNYFCQLVDAQTNNLISQFYTNVNNGITISIYDQEPGRRYRLRVFDQTDAWGKGTKGGLMGESGVAESCNATPVPINLSELPVPAATKLDFQFSCPAGKALDEASLPSLVKAQYSEVGKENWQDLLTATKTQRSVMSYKIQVGKRYDFRASLDGGATWLLRQNDYLVDKPEWTFKIKSEIYCK
ncbi:hypothetical protein [Fibrella aquatilis]|uniref:Carboxypeptidase regulatory-like domain-containing protein n=1 Tax=Fibrella aquatilis TaxID=2817059 RepID=A0A939G6R1_9BACT|nr:hypothetical protein [Fibrella aquatilis]MBO0933199.1 hypothetical protein [Fibrella aquatilis]